MGTEYFAGYITEKALSVDNLFVFLIIMTSFAVPRADQQKVLLFGIVFSLIARTGFIFLGAALINSFAWVFYIFGLILLVTAGNLLAPERLGQPLGRQHRRPARPPPVPHHEHYDGDKLFTDRERPARHDADAAGDGGHRRHRHPVRAGLDPGDLRPHAEHVHRLHRDGVLAARPAPAVLPHRRPARPPRLPRLRAGRDPRVHRRQARPARPAREQRAVHQRRRARRGHRDQHRAVAERHPRRPGGHRRRVAAEPLGPRAEHDRGRAPPRQGVPRRRETDPARRERIFAALSPRRASCETLPEKYRKRIREEEKLMDLLRRAHEAHAEALSTV